MVISHNVYSYIQSQTVHSLLSVYYLPTSSELVYRSTSSQLYKSKNINRNYVSWGTRPPSYYISFCLYSCSCTVELVRNLVAHGDAREGKWRGNCRIEWVASTLMPLPNVVYPALLKLMRTPRLLAVDWTDAPTDLNGLVRFEERRNLGSARVPSRSARAIQLAWWWTIYEGETSSK